jgi:hypothetical protein
MIGDAASMSVMIETIGSRNLRWLHRKRDDFMARDLSRHGSGVVGRVRVNSNGRSGTTMPHSIVRQNSRLQHAVSSLSSSSGSSSGNGSGAEEEQRRSAKRSPQKKQQQQCTNTATTAAKTTESGVSSDGAKKVSSSSSSNDTRQIIQSNDFHDYHAPSLPDPLLESGGSSPGSDSPRGDSDNCVVGGKHMCTDSSSGEEEKAAKKSKQGSGSGDSSNATNKPAAEVDGAPKTNFAGLPPNIARSGGIAHNVRPIAAATEGNLPNGHARLSRAPPTALPPFAGIGKKSSSIDKVATNQSSDGSKQPTAAVSSTTKPLSVAVPNPLHDGGQNNNKQAGLGGENYSHSGNIITIDNDGISSQSSSQNQRGIQAYYHINEDDMILTDDVLMCPFIFRSQEAVWCGALAECVMPGMLRASFSATNKLKNVEMIFDAMGFCQQLERASGNEGMAQIIPNSLEMVRCCMTLIGICCFSVHIGF